MVWGRPILGLREAGGGRGLAFRKLAFRKLAFCWHAHGRRQADNQLSARCLWQTIDCLRAVCGRQLTCGAWSPKNMISEGETAYKRVHFLKIFASSGWKIKYHQFCGQELYFANLNLSKYILAQHLKMLSDVIPQTLRRHLADKKIRCPGFRRQLENLCI